MSDYTYTTHTFPIDERELVEALGLDYDEVLASRKLAQEERDGIHGQYRREIRTALDDLQRENTRQMLFGPSESPTPAPHASTHDSTHA